MYIYYYITNFYLVKPTLKVRGFNRINFCEVAKLLIENGADVNVVSDLGITSSPPKILWEKVEMQGWKDVPDMKDDIYLNNICHIDKFDETAAHS